MFFIKKTVVAAVLVLSSASSGWAEGAIAFVHTKGNGMICKIVTDKPTLVEARDSAITDCLNETAQTEETRDQCRKKENVHAFSRQCAACATTKHGEAAAFAIEATNSEAVIIKALTSCRQSRIAKKLYMDGCRMAFVGCDGPRDPIGAH